MAGTKLDPEEVVKAREVEIGYADNKSVWVKIPRHVAKSKGWKIIKSRWIDVNKADDTNPVYRSRLVGKEFNDKVIEGLFAATPPLQALRLLLIPAATVEGRVLARLPVSQPEKVEKGILIADVSRAFFEAPARRDVCVELPEEALSEGESATEAVGKLMASLYGTRGASANWQEEVAKSMGQWGFIAGKYNPCTFLNEERGMRCLVHGDDFVCAGEVEQLEWFKKKLKERFEIKSTTVGMDQSAGEVREARILHKVIRVTEKGWEYEADQRHADLIVKETGADKLSTLTHPGGDKAVISAEGETDPLVDAEAIQFRALAARANYLSGDRPDIQYSVKEICRRMAKPVKGDWGKLIRLGRYLKGAPRCVQVYEWQ